MGIKRDIIVVTGGAGFIGSNIVHHYKYKSREEHQYKIVVVDNMDNKKFLNIVTADVFDIVRSENCMEYLEGNAHRIAGIFHQGAESSTTATDTDYVMSNNYELSKKILHFALDKYIPLLYASSASVYGDGKKGFIVDGARESYRPLNLYAFSKYSFDKYFFQVVEQPHYAKAKVIGLRYFNVYGPQESHKGSTASVVYHFYHQAKNHGAVKPFEGSEDFQRDFIHVDDVVHINMLFMDNYLQGRAMHPNVYNCGTGQTGTFQQIAEIVAEEMGVGVEATPFPEHLKGQYQTFTQADMYREGMITNYMSKNGGFTPLEKGVKSYLKVLKERDGYLVGKDGK